MSLLRRIELHLRRYRIPPSRFGRDAVGDPRLVSDLRRGRQLGGRLRHRVEACLTAQTADLARPSTGGRA